ncbi:hypothetical protein EXN66_Car000093 [Channa argus]|uniref:CCHC-type domain-containing protein n=1 Tax=Channa argus TaxID=215402 RepID=A0A6G1QWC5_CHAAH|nr:hypothetical protein EXN66_Car000093 [Channa argus]
MEFNMDEFTINPTIEKLQRCTKADLFLIASFFDVPVPLNARKAEVRAILSEKLVEEGVVTMPKPKQKVMTPERLQAGMEAMAAISQSAFSSPVGGEAKAPTRPPAVCVDPLSLLQAGVDKEELKLALRLKEVDLETKTREVELMHLRIRALELEKATEASTPSRVRSPSTTTSDQFDVSRHIALVPPFRETEVDCYFNAFERIAATLKWPKDVWSLLLQCKLVGKAQEVCASLSVEDSLNYDVVKTTVLPMSLFLRHIGKGLDPVKNLPTKKSVLFDKWCTASKVTEFEQLRELMLLEEFKTCLPERIVVYLNEQKVDFLSKAAVLADEFVLTHRVVFPYVHGENKLTGSPDKKNNLSSKTPQCANPSFSEGRECFYCHKSGHLIASCPVLQRKELSKSARRPKTVGFIRSAPATIPVHSLPEKTGSDSHKADESYKPFILEGLVSLTEGEKDQVPVNILRDTGASQSLILSNVLPFSSDSFCGSDALIGILKCAL